MRRRRSTTRLLIVGTTPLARQFADEIKRRPDLGYAVVGLVEECTADGSPRPLYRDRGNLDMAFGLDRIIDNTSPDRIVIAVADRRGRLPIQQLLRARVYRGIPVDDVTGLYEHLTGKLALEALCPSHVIFSEGFRPSRGLIIARRIVSLMVALLGLALTAPLLGVIAIAIKLDSPGSVLFAQQRVGFRGKPFTLFKFRTMHGVDKPPSEWARDNGHRVTRVGRWLRRCWLDELPQLVNILLGDMDLVGPRAHPVSNFELLFLVSRNVPEWGHSIPYYYLRSMVRPGLTGWAQVRYRYANDLDEEIEKLRYDLYYVKHLSLWMDLRVLFETVRMFVYGRSKNALEGSAPPETAPLPRIRNTVAPNGSGSGISVVSAEERLGTPTLHTPYDRIASPGDH